MFLITLILCSEWLRWQVDAFFDMFLVKKHQVILTLRLSQLGLKLNPLLTLRCLEEPPESRHDDRMLVRRGGGGGG